jgi:hypothetical protein
MLDPGRKAKRNELRTVALQSGAISMVKSIDVTITGSS